VNEEFPTMFFRFFAVFLTSILVFSSLFMLWFTSKSKA